MVSSKCNGCGERNPFVKNKPYCIECNRRMYRECPSCHRPYPNKDDFCDDNENRICNSCHWTYTTRQQQQSRKAMALANNKRKQSVPLRFPQKRNKTCEDVVHDMSSADEGEQGEDQESPHSPPAVVEQEQHMVTPMVSLPVNAQCPPVTVTEAGDPPPPQPKKPRKKYTRKNKSQQQPTEPTAAAKIGDSAEEEAEPREQTMEECVQNMPKPPTQRRKSNVKVLGTVTNNPPLPFESMERTADDITQRIIDYSRLHSNVRYYPGEMFFKIGFFKEA